MNIHTLPQTHERRARHGRAVGALILGGTHGSLAIARSLGRRGIPVSIAGHHLLPKLSRHVRRALSWNVDHPDALAQLTDLVGDADLFGDVVFAGGDSEVRFLAQNYPVLSSIFRMTTPPWQAIKSLNDKRLLRRHADATGVDGPASYAAASRGEVERLDCRFPVVLKPAVRDAANAFTLAKAWRADDRAALVSRWADAAALVGPDSVVIQELIPGGGETQFSFAAVWDRGEPVVSLTAQRLRQYPVEFGYTSTYVRTVDCPRVVEASRRLMAPLHYSGIAEIEFKYDRRDDRYKVLDVNTRAWTWAALGVAAGVDFPYAAWRVTMDLPAEPAHASRDAAWMHAVRDAVAAGTLMLRGALSPADYVKSLRTPMAFAAFAADDPLPGVAELPLALARTLTWRLPVMGRDLLAKLRRS